MKVLKIITQVAFIYLISILGEWVQSLLKLPIPGSIVGLLLLFLLLSCKVIPEKWIHTGANFLLTYMALFFIPATVGVMNYLDLFTGKGLLLIAALVISTCLVMIASGFVSDKLGKKVVEKEKEKYSA
ncbi:CidA/LrgA family protein [Caldibacillus lycopersici]|uniref:CidA/LrgA family protein n=1 Tax=Perspicuibacillus lycopersici TaxID=1325689 RepID=A0AAE3IUV4_9BACI|nr:CidA/LrgA family protein [Perspicuibacillus lycopersici]MCU9615065.1 CidA/LrgA family protein [Perspicuibacillus lycopersici]